jgi:hypothetical protein
MLRRNTKKGCICSHYRCSRSCPEHATRVCRPQSPEESKGARRFPLRRSQQSSSDDDQVVMVINKNCRSPFARSPAVCSLSLSPFVKNDLVPNLYVFATVQLARAPPRKYSAGWATFCYSPPLCPHELLHGGRDTWRQFLGRELLCSFVNDRWHFNPNYVNTYGSEFRGKDLTSPRPVSLEERARGTFLEDRRGTE